MNYQELSIKDLRKVDKELYNKIKRTYKYDLVIFIAKGSYLIGKDFSDFNNCSLLEISASRKGGNLKKILRPLLNLIPNKLKVYLRKKEMDSNVHSSNSDRNVCFNENIWKNHKQCKRILLVDDSIDTGYSVLLAKSEIEKFFKGSDIKVAVLNYFEKAKDIFIPDYYLYKNTIIKGPWSNDSKENKKYLKMYYKWKEAEYK